MTEKALQIRDLTQEQYAQLMRAVKDDFYHELDANSLFQEELVEGLEKYIPWVSAILSLITLIVVIAK